MGQRTFLTKRYYKSERSPRGSLRNGGAQGRSSCWHGAGSKAWEKQVGPGHTACEGRGGRVPHPPQGKPQSASELLATMS